jgi:hypothetical protein
MEFGMEFGMGFGGMALGGPQITQMDADGNAWDGLVCSQAIHRRF